MAERRRARDWGIPFPGETGPWNAITDVPGVLVGTTTLIAGDGPRVVGVGPVRTGVTAILPAGHTRPLRPIWAGFHRFNGNGEMTGTHWIQDGGYFLGPILLTNTHSVGMAHHAAVRWMIERYGEDFGDRLIWAMPVVAETYDGVLNDINGQHVRAEHVWAALDDAKAGPVPEGNVGGGTGMICYRFKGGTGTASRRITVAGRALTVGALVQANFGIRRWLTVLGVPVGELWPDTDPIPPASEQGSVIAVIGTDAPLLPHQLDRLARRGTVGIARTGTYGGNSSGDLFLAFSVANPMPIPERQDAFLHWEGLNDEYVDGIYEAAASAVEEAVVNALLMAEPMTTPDGHLVPALDGSWLVSVLARYGRGSGADRR
jgi:D-aminopeptidase